MFKMGGSTNSGIMTGLVDRKGYAEDTGIKSRVVAKSARDYISDLTRYYKNLHLKHNYHLVQLVLL